MTEEERQTLQALLDRVAAARDQATAEDTIQALTWALEYAVSLLGIDL